MKKRNYLNSTSFYILICLLVGWANMQTLQAQEPIDTLVLNINNDYVSTLPNEGVEIFALQNDICSNEEDPNCVELLNSLVITDFTQPEFGNINFQDNYFIYQPSEGYEGYDVFGYTVTTFDGNTAFGQIFVYVGPDVLPFPWNIHPCLTAQIWPTPANHCPIIYQPSCNLICNPSIGCTITRNPENINYGNTPHWFALQGTPNVGISDPFNINCGAMSMWRQTDGYGEAAATKLSAAVTPSNVYLLTYTRKNSHQITCDEFVTRLDNNLTNIGTVPGTAPHFVIDTDPNILPNVPEQRVANCFSPDASYKQLTMYPRQTVSPQYGVQTGILIDQVELVEYPLPLGYDLQIECGDTVTIYAPCHNTGTTWEWYDATTNTLLHIGDSYTTNPITQATTVDLRLNINADIINCNTYDIGATYHYTPIGSCCCDDFVNMIHNSPISANVAGTNVTFTPPSGIQANDNVYWDFDCNGVNDLVSQGNGTVSWTYPSPGSCNYVACMTAEHIQADGDTCRAKQTKFITIDENCESCLYFDGSDRISVPNSAAILDGIGNGNFTFEAKIKGIATGQSNDPMLFSNRTAFNGVLFSLLHPVTSSTVFELNVQVGANNYFIVTNNGGNNGIDLLDDVCHHVAVSKSGTTIDFYIDGALIGTITGVSTASIATGADIVIGDDNVSPNPFTGNISDLRIWNVARTQAEIQSTMNTALIGNEIGLAANWPLNDGTGQNVVEIVNNVNGVLGTDATVQTNDPSWGYNCCETVCLACNQNDTCCNCNDEFYNDVDLGYFSFPDDTIVTFIPKGNFNQACDSIKWVWNDGTADGHTLGNDSISHTLYEGFIYEICMIVYRDIDQDGEPDCNRDFCEIVTNIPLSPPIFDKLNIYPNPTKNDLFIELISIVSEKASLKVIDILGRTIFQQNEEIRLGDNNFQLKVQNFKAGTYFLEIETKRGKTTKKFFVL